MTRRLPDRLRGDGPCGDCGSEDNVVWSTESAFWNVIMRPNGETGDPFLCIACFVIRADAAGYAPTGWQLIPDFHWETRDERWARKRRDARRESTP